MKWKKLGLVWAPDGSTTWAISHATLPTPFLLNDDVIRIFLYSRDRNGRGLPIYVDVDASNPLKVFGASSAPLLSLGRPGEFDDNGVVPSSVIRVDKKLYMYYSGFELCEKIPYRILGGLAVGIENEEVFSRFSNAPILERSNIESYFRCSPFILHDEGIFKLWYIGGNSWATVNGKLVPEYDLRYLESIDGIQWADHGVVSMKISAPDEHGFGRPWVVKRGPNKYQLFYSIRRRSLGAYRLGYAESTDGISWIRKDNEMNLDVTSNEFDSDAIMYSAVISVGDKTYCFYNGNNFGEKGFAVAELVSGY